MNSNIKGDNNKVLQIDTLILNQSDETIEINKYMQKLIVETVEEEKNPTIIYTKTILGRSIQCGNCRFSVGDSSCTEREMSYWEDALERLYKYGFIRDKGNKGEVFGITPKGYELYDKIMSENIK